MDDDERGTRDEDDSGSDVPPDVPLMVVTERTGNHFNRMLQQQYKAANTRQREAEAAQAVDTSGAAESGALSGEDAAEAAAAAELGETPDWTEALRTHAGAATNGTTHASDNGKPTFHGKGSARRHHASAQDRSSDRSPASE